MVFAFQDDDEDDAPTFKIDRPDVKQNSQTTFVYNRNPGQYFNRGT